MDSKRNLVFHLLWQHPDDREDSAVPHRPALPPSIHRSSSVPTDNHNQSVPSLPPGCSIVTTLHQTARKSSYPVKVREVATLESKRTPASVSVSAMDRLTQPSKETTVTAGAAASRSRKRKHEPAQDDGAPAARDAQTHQDDKRKKVEKLLQNTSMNREAPIGMPRTKTSKQKPSAAKNDANELAVLLNKFNKDVKKKKKSVNVRLPKKWGEAAMTYLFQCFESVGIKTRGQGFGALFYHFLEQDESVLKKFTTQALTYSWPASQLLDFSLPVNNQKMLQFRNSYGLYHTYRVFMPAILWAIKDGVPLLNVEPNSNLVKSAPIRQS